MTRAVSDVWATKQVKGYEESYSRTGSKVTEVYSVPWATRTNDITLLLTNAHSDTTNFPFHYASQVSCVGVGWGDGATTPTNAELTVNYELFVPDEFSDWIES